MTVEENKALVRRFFEGMHLGDVPSGEILADDYRNHGFDPPMDRDAAEEVLRQFRDGIADAGIDIKEQIGEGDLVATRYVLTGTHRGGFPAGIPATGRRISVPGLSIHRVRNGKIVEDRPNFDQLILLIQLGVVPAPEGVATDLPDSRGSSGNRTQSREELVGMLERFYQGALSKGNLALVDEMLAEDYVDTSPSFPPGFSRDREGLKQVVAAYRKAFSDWSVRIEEAIVEGDNAVLRCSWTGKHTGPLPGLDLPPTGKQVRYGSVDLCRGRDNKGVEHYSIFDQVAMLQQLGVIPAPEQAAV